MTVMLYETVKLKDIYLEKKKQLRNYDIRYSLSSLEVH